MRVDTSAQHLAMDQNPRPLQGVLWTLQGSAFYSLLFIFPNLWGEGLSPYQLAWFRFVGGFVSLTPLMLYFVLSGQSVRLLPTPGLLGWHALRAAFGALTFLCSIVAVLNIDQANASAITMTSGVFTVALAMLLLGERPNRLVLLAGVIALVGGVVTAEPNFGAVAQFVSLGALAAFGAAFTLGAQFTILKFITDRDSTFILVVGMALFGSIYLAPFALLNWEPVSWFQLTVFLGMGLLANLGQLGNVMAFRHASASFIAPVKYGGIVMTMLWAFFLLGQVPSLTFWIGAGLITLGGLVLARSRGSAR